MTEQKKRRDKGAYECYKRNLEDNGAEIMMHGNEIYLREDVTGKTVYTHWPAKRGVLLYNWFAVRIDELRDLSGEELSKPEQLVEPIDSDSFAGLLLQVEQQTKEMSEDLDKEDEDRDHPLNPFLQRWLLQIQVLKAMRQKENTSPEK